VDETPRPGVVDRNIGRLRTRYEDECTTIVAGGQARIEYWSAKLDD
jgi:hypothetical protein